MVQFLQHLIKTNFLQGEIHFDFLESTQPHFQPTEKQFFSDIQILHWVNNNIPIDDRSSLVHCAVDVHYSLESLTRVLLAMMLASYPLWQIC